MSGVLAARLLGVAGRGHLALLMVIPGALAYLGTLGLPLAVTYFVARRPSSAAAVARSLLAPALAQAGILFGLHALVLYLVFVGEPASVRLAALVTLAWVPAALAHQYGLALLQGRQRFRAFNAARLFPVAAYSAGVAALFVIDWNDLPLVALAWTVSYVVAAAVTLAAGLSQLRSADASPGPPTREMLRFGVRGLLGSVSPVESFKVDQIIVGLLLSPAALGLYVVAMAFTNLPRIVAQSIGMVVYPSIAAQHDAGSAARLARRSMLATLASSVAIVVVLLASVGWLLPLAFGDEFAPAVPAARIVLVAALFLSLRRVASDVLRGAGRAGAGTVAELVSWVVLVPAIVFLARPFGIEGVAIAVTLSAAASLSVILFAARTRLRVPHGA